MQRRISFGFAAILLALAGGAPACDGDSQTSPSQPPTVAAGQVVATPAGAGLVDVTAFSFTAQGFSASGGGALTYQWDFNDGTRTTGGAAVWGDQTFLNCRYSVSGTITLPRAISVTWAHLPGDLRTPTDCQALPAYIPWTVTFTGTANDQFDVFTGTMTPGGAAVLRRCAGPGGC